MPSNGLVSTAILLGVDTQELLLQFSVSGILGIDIERHFQHCPAAMGNSRPHLLEWDLFPTFLGQYLIQCGMEISSGIGKGAVEIEQDTFNGHWYQQSAAGERHIITLPWLRATR